LEEIGYEEKILRRSITQQTNAAIRLVYWQLAKIRHSLTSLQKTSSCTAPLISLRVSLSNLTFHL